MAKRSSPEGASKKNGTVRSAGSVVRRFGYLPFAFKGSEQRYDQSVRNTLDQDPRSLNARERPTIVDLKSIPVQASDEYLIETSARWLGVVPDLLAKNGEESKELYEKLNRSLRIATQYLRDILHCEQYVPETPPEVHSSKELLALLRQTTQLHGEVEGLSRRAMYCALITTAFAAYEAQKSQIEALIGEAKYLEHKMTDPFAGHLFDVSEDIGQNAGRSVNERKFRNMYNQPGIVGSMTVRGKSIASFMTKFLSRPEASANTELNDGIAMRVTVSKAALPDAIESTAKWFKEEMRAYGPLVFENDNLFDEKRESTELSAIEGRLDSIVPGARITQNEQNPSSAGRFAAFKITGECAFPAGGNIMSRKVPRRFEVQFVVPHNRNDRGTLNHYIYDVVRRVSVMTRLFGSCSETIFNKYIDEAAFRSGMSPENIVAALTNPKNGRLIVHKAKTRSTRPRYVVASHYLRRQDFDLGDDPVLYGEVLHKKNG